MRPTTHHQIEMNIRILNTPEYVNRLELYDLTKSAKSNLGSSKIWLVVGPPLWKMMEFVNWDDNRNPILMGQ